VLSEATSAFAASSESALLFLMTPRIDASRPWDSSRMNPQRLISRGARFGSDPISRSYPRSPSPFAR
jgi:hypothetical protein